MTLTCDTADAEIGPQCDHHVPTPLPPQTLLSQLSVHSLPEGPKDPPKIRKVKNGSNTHKRGIFKTWCGSGLSRKTDKGKSFTSAGCLDGASGADVGNAPDQTWEIGIPKLATI